jgi:hypothetical protein
MSRDLRGDFPVLPSADISQKQESRPKGGSVQVSEILKRLMVGARGFEPPTPSPPEQVRSLLSACLSYAFFISAGKRGDLRGDSLRFKEGYQ